MAYGRSNKRRSRNGPSAETILQRLYYNPKNPAAFSGVQKLYEAAIKKKHTITLNDVKNWLKGQLTYTLHKPICNRIKRNPIVVSYIDEQWQADLVDMQEYKSANDGYVYILTVIDIFSKYAWAIPMKNKTGLSVKAGFEKIFEDRIPSKLQTDKGKEFINTTCKALYNKFNIVFFTSKSPGVKCAVVERFNRTLKSKMFKFFTSNGTRRYIDVLQSFVHAYNKTYHRSIRMSPESVNDHRKNEVFRNLYGYESLRDMLKTKSHVSKLTPGQTVRVRYTPKAFDKGYFPNWTDNTYKVERVIKGFNQPIVKLEDKGELLDRPYYPNEVQGIIDPVYRVERVLQHRKTRGRTEYLVKWLNYPSSENSWIPAKDLVNL